MICVPEGAGERTYAPPRFDNLNMVHHMDGVRLERTHVNVENEHGVRDFCRMVNGQTIGEQLRELQELSGLSYESIAKKAGYSGRSSVQRYFDPTYDDKYLPLRVAEKLALGFEGSVVSSAAIMALAGLPETNAKIIHFEGASSATLPRDIPVFGTALGAPREFDGKAIEQTALNSGEVLAYLPRPTVLNGQKGAYGLFTQGSSMAPRFEEGDTVFVQRGGTPPRIGDDVVVYLRDEERDDGDSSSAVLIKRLVRRTSNYTELEQFNPPMVFRLAADRILRIDRVIPWRELLS